MARVSRDPALATLVADLASPDPAVRDEGAYAALARLMREGALGADDRAWLGSAMLERLEHERVEARAFAPLVLASLVAAGDFEPNWVPAVTRWYVGEQVCHDGEPVTVEHAALCAGRISQTGWRR